MLTDPSQRPPGRFAVLALCLVLPALGLAVMAARTMALDRRLAEAEGRTQLQYFANAVAARLTNAFHLAQPFPLRSGRPAGSPTPDGVVWMEIGPDQNGELREPALGIWPPVPRPLPALKPPLKAVWERAEAAMARGDWKPAATDYEQFIEVAARENPSPRDRTQSVPTHLLLAAQRATLAASRSGDVPTALRILDRAWNDAWNRSVMADDRAPVLTEAGVNALDLLALQTLEIAGTNGARLPTIWQRLPQSMLDLVASQPFTPLQSRLEEQLAPLLPALAATPPGLSVSNLLVPFRQRTLTRRAYQAMVSFFAARVSTNLMGLVSKEVAYFPLDRDLWVAVKRPWPESMNQPSYLYSLHRLGELTTGVEALDPAGRFRLQTDMGQTGAHLSRRVPAGELGPITARWSGEVRPGLSVTVTAAPVDSTTFFAPNRRREQTWMLLVVGAVGVSLIAAFTTWWMLVRQHRLSVQKSNLMAAVSHELRSPLASVRLLADNLQHGRVGDESRRADSLQLIGRECRRLGTLVDNVLDLTRIERGRQHYEFAPTNVSALIRETVASIAILAAEKDVRIQIQMPADIEFLEANVDGRALQQALGNVLDNAVKHTPPGSEIVVQLSRSDGVGNNDSPTQPSGYFRLTISDSGPGIPATERERVFESFHRIGSELQRQTTGVGIGLVIVRHIVEAHHGRVWIEPATPTGTRVVLDLPLDTTPPKA